MYIHNSGLENRLTPNLLRVLGKNSLQMQETALWPPLMAPLAKASPAIPLRAATGRAALWHGLPTSKITGI